MLACPNLRSRRVTPAELPGFGECLNSGGDFLVLLPPSLVVVLFCSCSGGLLCYSIRPDITGVLHCFSCCAVGSFR